MDCPNGYVCRVRKSEAVRYPSSQGLFIKSIKKCLRLIWCSRLTMEKTIETITEPEDEEDTTLSFKLTPCFFGSDKKNQKNGKRKLEEMQENNIFKFTFIPKVISMLFSKFLPYYRSILTQLYVCSH